MRNPFDIAEFAIERIQDLIEFACHVDDTWLEERTRFVPSILPKVQVG